MKDYRLLAGMLVSGFIFAPLASGERIPTNFGTGADAEVRESNPTQNRGDSTELASRVRNDSVAGDANDGSDRNSAFYTRFDLSGVAIPPTFETAFSLTYRNNNLVGSRVQDTITPNPAIRTGLAIYGLDPSKTWSEDAITYLTAPGITFDGDIGTVDLNDDLTFLGTVEFPEIGSQNHLPIGGELRFCSDNLDEFVRDALDNGFTAVTLASMRIHGGDSPFSNWINFNYLFNPKEQATLNEDNYDPDGQGSIGNLTSTDNSTGDFSPALIIEDDAALETEDLCAFIPLNEPPDCSSAYASVDALWPVNHKFVPVNILGVTDPDGDPTSLTIDSIYQDEPTNGLGDGDTWPDGAGLGTDTASVRAERAGPGNGRVYTIAYTADDGNSGQCSGQATVSVARSQGANATAVNDGPNFDSTVLGTQSYRSKGLIELTPRVWKKKVSNKPMK